MSRSPSPSLQKGSVRNIISIFENQTYSVNDEPSNLIRRTKSLGSLVQRPQVTKRVVEQEIIQVEPEVREKNLELVQIGQQIQHLQKNLSNNYRSYSRDNHIYYQNQIVFILTDLANVDTRSNAKSIHKKSELAEDLKRLNKKLNGLLPASEQSVVTPTVVITKNEKTPVTPTAERKKWNVTPSPRKEHQQQQPKIEEQQRVEEIQEEEEEIVVSVRSLKQMFEANTNDNEAKREFGQTTITRRFLSFNGADSKYIPYSEKYKNSFDEDSNERGSTNLFDDAIQNSFSSQLVIDGEEKEENFSADSLSESSSSGEDSEVERTASEGDGAKED